MASSARIPSALVAAAVRECLRAPGLPIRDILDAATHPGDAAARPFRDEAVWHSKPEIDRCVAARLKLDADRVAGPRRDDNEMYKSVANEISRLRRNGRIQDWRAGSGLGVWRLAGPLPPDPPAVLATSTAEGGPFSGGAASGAADPQAPLYCVFTALSGRAERTTRTSLPWPGPCSITAAPTASTETRGWSCPTGTWPGALPSTTGSLTACSGSGRP